jgi:membrane protease YdiL (CAAX protease family)
MIQTRDLIISAPPPSRPVDGSDQPADKSGGVRAWAAQRPVTAFLVLAFGIACPVMALPALAEHGVISDGWMPQLPGLDTERIASALLVFVALLPAALWVTWAADGPTGVRTLVRRMFRWQIGPWWWLIVLAALPTLTITIALLMGDTFTPVEVAPFVATQLLGLLVNLLLINIWEEAAWSGVVQTRLERRHDIVAAALLTAVPFALVHMPLHFIGPFSPASLVAVLVALLIICALVRVMIGVVLRGTRDSILAIALLHTVFNRSNNDEGVVAGLTEGDARGLAGLLAVLLLTAVIAIFSRRRLSRSYRHDLDASALSTASPAELAGEQEVA